MHKTLISISLMFLLVNNSSACQFIEDKQICKDEKISILDASASELNLDKNTKTIIKYGIENICKEDMSCVEYTLLNTLNKKAITSNTYLKKDAHLTCIEIYKIYPTSNMIIYKEDKQLHLGSISEDIFKDELKTVYIIENNDLNIETCNAKLKLTKIKAQ